MKQPLAQAISKSMLCNFECSLRTDVCLPLGEREIFESTGNNPKIASISAPALRL